MQVVSEHFTNVRKELAAMYLIYIYVMRVFSISKHYIP